MTWWVRSARLLRGVESVAVVDGQDVQCLLPVADLAGEVLAVAASGGGDEVEDLHRGLLVREMTAVTDCSAESSVQRLDRVCRVDDPAELDGELEQRNELLPCVLPGADHRGVSDELCRH